MLRQGPPPTFGAFFLHGVEARAKCVHGAGARCPKEHPRSQILFVFCIGKISRRTPQIADTTRVLHRNDLHKNTQDRSHHLCFASKRPPKDHPRSQLLFVFCIGKNCRRAPQIADTIRVLHRKDLEDDPEGTPPGRQPKTESEPPRKFYTVFIVFVSQAGTKSAPGRISPLSEQKNGTASRREQNVCTASRRKRRTSPFAWLGRGAGHARFGSGRWVQC